MRGWVREGAVKRPFLEHIPDLVGIELHATGVILVVIKLVLVAIVF